MKTQINITIQMIIVVILIVVFIAGFFVLLNNGLRHDSIENESPSVSGCPNLLVRKGNKLSLLNSNAPYNPGKNPLFFKDLEEYKKYVEIQNKNGFFCPVLYLQEENNAQGKDIYKMYSNPFETENGLQSIQLKNSIDPLEITYEEPVEENKIVFNIDRYYTSFNSFGKYDKDELYNNNNTKNDTSSSPSDNAMDSNWNGIVQEKDKR